MIFPPLYEAATMRLGDLDLDQLLKLRDILTSMKFDEEAGFKIPNENNDANPKPEAEEQPK
jgi:hypothetical protein